MNITEEQYKDLTRYLDNEMSVEEETVFLDRLTNDEQLRHYYDFEVNLREYLEVSHLKKNVPNFSISELANKNQPHTIAKGIAAKEIKRGKKKVVSFKKWIMYASAACVIGVAGFLIWFNSNLPKKQNNIVENANNRKENKNDTLNNVAKNQINYDTIPNRTSKVDTSNTGNVVIHEHKNKKKLISDSTGILARNNEQTTVKSRRFKSRNKVVDSLIVPTNKKTEENETAIRGDVYGPDYANIVIDNRTNYSIDIYIDRNYRGTIAAWNKIITWTVSGNTKLYAKARFNDGTYYYWRSDLVVVTGHEFIWQLHY